MIHGSCVIVIGRRRGKSSHPSPAAIAEVARDLPAISEKVLPHFLLIGHFPVGVDGVIDRAKTPPQEFVTHSKNAWSVPLLSKDRTSPSAAMCICGVLSGSVGGLEHSVALGGCAGTVFGNSDVRRLGGPGARFNRKCFGMGLCLYRVERKKGRYVARKLCLVTPG